MQISFNIDIKSYCFLEFISQRFRIFPYIILFSVIPLYMQFSRSLDYIMGKKRAKYCKIWAKMYKIWKYFEKGQPIACMTQLEYALAFLSFFTHSWCPTISEKCASSKKSICDTKANESVDKVKQKRVKKSVLCIK